MSRREIPIFMKRIIVTLIGALAALGLVLAMPAIVSAACSNPNQQSCSGSYGVSETFFGTGGTLCDPTNPSTSFQSSNYCAKTSVGELGVGNSLGTLYQAQAGFNTNREPSLAVLVNDSRCPDYDAVNGATRDLGVLDSASTKTTSVNFSAMSYLASGYVVQTSGQPPTYTGGHTFATPTYFTSATNTEQFGINLVHNTSPAVGNDASQLPDATFGFGAASAGGGAGTSTDYAVQNRFNYNNNDVIASSSKSSGVTCYDISYVFNIKNTTPAGTYTFNQSIVVTSTF